MKENPKLISLTPKNVQINYFSKQLGKYDCELTFNKKLNLFLHLHKKTPIFNQKELQKIFSFIFLTQFPTKSGSFIKTAPKFPALTFFEGHPQLIFNSLNPKDFAFFAARLKDWGSLPPN